MNVIIAGGGAAGMFAAACLAEKGISVTIIEHNEKLGKKLFITGKGRCNFTNACTVDEFMGQILSNPKFMYSAANAFPPSATMNWFEEHGLAIKTERGRRVFPESDRAIDVIDTLNGVLKKHHVRVLLNTELLSISTAEDGSFRSVTVKDKKGKKKLSGDTLILATGGRSYPSTGSVGDSYRFAEDLHMEVTGLYPSLVPFVCREEFVRMMQGLSIKNVRLRIKEGKKTLFDEFGELLFTHFGISGPLVLSASAKTGPMIGKRKLLTEIDLKPAVTAEELSKRFENTFKENPKKYLKNILTEFYPQKMAPVIPSLAGLDPLRTCASISGAERDALVQVTKHFPLTVTALRGYNEAIITKGGISVKEISPRTMESKQHPGIYVVGEMLDLDAYTGGYNLQIAWSTAYAAAEAISASQYPEIER